tara:strand:+ start:1048 stop:1179 length:132 start_codon:yes stop_codon:yes gene_type:complete
MKFIKKRLIGGRLNEVMEPNRKGTIRANILFCKNNVNLFIKII